MRVLPILLVIFLLTSVMAVSVPTSDLDDGQEKSPDSLSDTERFIANGWNITVIDSGMWNAMVDLHLDSANIPSIAYYPVGEVRFAEKHGNIWNLATLAQTNVGGAQLDLAIDQEDKPHVFYDHDIVIRHAVRTPSGWTYLGAVDPGRSNDARPSSVMIDSGNGWLAYVSKAGGNRRLRLGALGNGSWNWTDIANLGRQDYLNPNRLSAALDSQGRIHIAFYNDEQNELQYLSQNGSGWTIEGIVSCKDGSFVGMPSLDIGDDDTPVVAFGDGGNTSLVVAERLAGSWHLTTVDSNGTVGGSPSLSIDHLGQPHIAYEDYSNISIKFAVRTGGIWNIETVYDDNSLGAKYPSLDLDSCGFPHLAFYVFSDETVKYASQGIPCPKPEAAEIVMDIDPDTLNLKSRGRWITAYLSSNASEHDIDVSTILLQDTLAPERWTYQDDVLMLKFSRQEFKDIVQVGDSVQVKITGKWKDGTAFEAYDNIRVIDPGK